MNANSTESSQPQINLKRAAVGFLLYLFLIPAIIFVSAGTTLWPMAWLYVALLLISTLLSRLIVYFKNPDTLLERARYTSPPEDSLPQDRWLSWFIGSVGAIALMIIAGLDFRYGWSPEVPVIYQYLAAALLALGYAFGTWAMVVNRFFSAVVRLQHDRGHTVVTTGPYQFVRHPAYTGSILANLTFPFMLSSYWGLIPALILVVATIYRTKLEDDLLAGGLDGYREYSQIVRYRLVPGLW